MPAGQTCPGMRAHRNDKQLRPTLSSGQPRGKPLYPIPRIILSGLTMQAPTCDKALSPTAALESCHQLQQGRLASVHLLVGVLGALGAQERHSHEVVLPR